MHALEISDIIHMQVVSMIIEALATGEADAKGDPGEFIRIKTEWKLPPEEDSRKISDESACTEAGESVSKTD